MLTICVDFDGTIVDHRYPGIGPAVPGAIAWMRSWREECDAKLILWTIRSGHPLREAEDYLRERGVDLFGVNHNPDQGKWSASRKVYAHIYVDDAAHGCPLIKPDLFARECVNWSIVGPHVRSRLREAKTEKDQT